jgi:hypothetical protein
MSIGKSAREAFLLALKLGGTTCDVSGEERKAVKDHGDGTATRFMFVEEFPLKIGDKIREVATESYFTVTEMQPVAAADCFLYFEVTTRRDL